MLDAVLFDWGDTLMRFEWDPDVLAAGHAAGLEAIGRPPMPSLSLLFTESYRPLFEAPGVLEEIGYEGIVTRLLAEAGTDAGPHEVARFIEAEHAAWEPMHELASTTHALLETLRGRGLKLGIVSNAFDPPGLLRRDLERLGVAQRIDAAVFASEAGVRKPHPAIFLRALDELGVDAPNTLFVGDSLTVDIAGAAALGMQTCQSVWFRADDEAAGPEPDFQAFTQMDVVSIVRRLSAH